MSDFLDFITSFQTLRDTAWFIIGALAWELARRFWTRRNKTQTAKQVSQLREETRQIKDLLAQGSRTPVPKNHAML